MGVGGWPWTPTLAVSFGRRRSPRKRMLLGRCHRPKAWCLALPFPLLATCMRWTPWMVPFCGQLQLVPASTVVYPSVTLVSSWEMATPTALLNISLTHPRALPFLPFAYENQTPPQLNQPNLLEIHALQTLSKFCWGKLTHKTVKALVCLSMHIWVQDL